jgi:GTP-binding protein LepA
LKEIKYLTPTRSTLLYELPLAEVITDFFDQLKSRSQGYASMEYSIIEYRAGEESPPANIALVDFQVPL